jgi:His/Glu/Gln/Arg/opine family amino acid ABC transporter permease subunit
LAAALRDRLYRPRRASAIQFTAWLTRVFDPALVPLLLFAGIVTIQISVGAWLVSAVFALPLALARDAPWRGVRHASGAVTTILRSVPQLVALYVLYYAPGALGLTPPPLIGAVIGLGVIDASYLAEYYHGALMTVSNSQRDAGRSLAMSGMSILRFIVLPQALPFAVPPLVNSFVGLLKAATLASALGIPEVLWRARDAMARTGQIIPVTVTVIVIYLAVTMPLAWAAASLERRVRESRS